MTSHDPSMHEPAATTPSLPVAPVNRWLAPVTRFLHIEAASGIVLLACTAVALALANSPWAAWFAALWKTPVSLGIGAFVVSGDIGHLVVNDGLMTVFFFVVGLELKRELVHGELREPRKALLPVFAALGGVLVPALVYLTLQWGEPGERGWAIPMATDIAFVVGFLALFGPRVPLGLKILMLSLAIVDDLVAVLIIAFVFTETIAWSWLGMAAIAFGLVAVLHRIGVRAVGTYVVLGVFIWLAFLQSGVHPTVAGVLLGLLTPAQAWVGTQAFGDVLQATWERVVGTGTAPETYATAARQAGRAAYESVSPLHRLEQGLHPWVAFVVMPVFALANAGVSLSASGLGEPVAVATAIALTLGKPVGIVLLCALAVRLRVTELPAGVTWAMLVGGACLAGIGFTMSLFLNTLAFPVDQYAALESAGKIGILVGSGASALIGGAVLMRALASTAVGERSS